MKPPIEAAIIALADQPLITSVELSQFIAAHVRARERIVAATCNGVRGPPCLFPRAYFDDLMQLHGMQGARSLLERHAAQVDALAISCGIDIDVQEDITRLRAL
jgi:molybdenum cofactor cytidylyltransferase